ncbi:MAG: hypothetical protein ACTHN5_10945, partial [Phycisphaerae bacterium]
MVGDFRAIEAVCVGMGAPIFARGLGIRIRIKMRIKRVWRAWRVMKGVVRWKGWGFVFSIFEFGFSIGEM